MQPGYQGRLDKYVSDNTDADDTDESAVQPATIASNECATGQEAEA